MKSFARIPLRAAPILLALGLAAIASACASSPAREVPKWVLAVPAPDATTTWFTGSASIDGRDVAGADEAATADLVASIMRYVGAKVSVESSAVAKATLDSYKADITQSVHTAADNRVAGFSIKDRYVAWDPAARRSTVYILAGYRTVDLEAEKKRIAAVFAEKVDAVAAPEAQGDNFASQNRDWDAAGSYVNAAVAASASDIDNADLKFRRNLDKALAAVSTLRVEITPPQGTAYVASAWPGPFVIRVLQGSSGTPVPGTAILVSYPRRQGPRIAQRTVSATTDAKGVASFLPPSPDFVGDGRFSVRVDFDALSTKLDTLPARLSPSADALRQAFATAAAEVKVSVATRAAAYQTAVALVDEAGDGTALATRVAAQALMDAFVQAGVATNLVSVDPALVDQGNDGAVIQAVAAAGKNAQRIVYGQARVLSTRNDGGAWLATVRVSARVLDVSAGRLLWSGERQASSVGSDESSAIAAAMRDAGGNTLAAELLASLP